MSPGTFFTIIFLTNILGSVCPDVICSGSPAESLLSIARKPCQVPSSKHYYFMSSEGNGLNPNEPVDGSGKVTVIVKCFSPSKQISPVDFAVCFDGQWYPSQHSCEQKKCTALRDTFSTLYTCTSSANGVEGKCSQPADPGTKVTVRCSHWRYTLPDVARNTFLGHRSQHETTCAQSGEWQALELCYQDCGLALNTGSKYDSKHFWLAVIFNLENGKWNQECLGTMVSTFLVITSYNCFPGEDWDSTEQKLSIGVGKYSRNYVDYPPSSLYHVKSVYWNNQRTIVLLRVDRYIAFSDTVGIVCPSGFSYNVAETGLIAIQRKNVNSTLLETTKSLALSTNEDCKFSTLLSGKIIRSDEFCSITNNHRFSANDIGAGLISTNKNGRYYVLGLLSALLFDSRVSSGEKVPIFLNITTEMNLKFIDEIFGRSGQAVIEDNEFWFWRREDDSN